MRECLRGRERERERVERKRVLYYNVVNRRLNMDIHVFLYFISSCLPMIEGV